MPTALAFAPAAEADELREYLGDEYDESHLHDYQGFLDAEVEEAGDEARFYRTSRAYLYNLTAFAMTGTKLPYLELLVKYLPRGARVLDYGCGIGSDGLLLLDAGYRVEFADFDNPSTEYLRWRLARRGLEAKIHDLDGEVPGDFDAAYAFDVIEHVPQPYSLLAEMESRAAMVMVNLLEYDAHEQALHYRLPIRRLLLHAARRGLLQYQVHHETSHVLLYRTARVGPIRASRNLASMGKVTAKRWRAQKNANRQGPS